MTANEVWHNCIYTAVGICSCVFLAFGAVTLFSWSAKNTKKQVNDSVDCATSQVNSVVNNATSQVNSVVNNATSQVDSVVNNATSQVDSVVNNAVFQSNLLVNNAMIQATEVIFQTEDRVMNVLRAVDGAKVFGFNAVKIPGLDEAYMDLRKRDLKKQLDHTFNQLNIVNNLRIQQGVEPLDINKDPAIVELKAALEYYEKNIENLKRNRESKLSSQFQSNSTSSINNCLSSTVPGGLPTLTYDRQNSESQQSNNNKTQVNNGGLWSTIRDLFTGNLFGEDGIQIPFEESDLMI